MKWLIIRVVGLLLILIILALVSHKMSPDEVVTPNSTETPFANTEAPETKEIEIKGRFVYFGAEWCPPCRKMKKETLPDDEVKKSLKSYKIEIYDTDELDDDSKALAEKLGVKYIPTYGVFDSDGEVDRMNVGFLSPEEFIKWLEE